jgi:hypothetical protein
VGGVEVVSFEARGVRYGLMMVACLDAAVAALFDLFLLAWDYFEEGMQVGVLNF